ncbi:O-antigen ligase family protein [Falsibacillus albus]|uniref:O-antigen ligase domain-containing protein n=1 Tax=Falsibacillus albus TaxID=2478915 RepID=A0A3L7K115_9BACI|nr:O-antigen ligase family protein [Falsibacillus albus]RLQ96746.1 O-antigen ligase domain-containing protein [Falsibacillus albus]
MHHIRNNLKRWNTFESGLGLCFLLPPIGVGLLLIKGLASAFNYTKSSKKSFSLMHLYFISLVCSSMFAAIHSADVVLFGAGILNLGYFGIYLSLTKNRMEMNIGTYKWIIIIGGIYNCLIGWVLDGVSINPVIRMLTGTEVFQGRLVGSSYNPNFTMYILLLALAFILSELLTSIRARKWAYSAWYCAGILVLAKGMIDTGSRAAFITMMILYAIFLFQLNKKLFITGFTLTLLNIKWIFEIMPRSGLIDKSIGVRTEIWENSIELIGRHPLVGVTPFGFYKEYANSFPYSGNTIIHPHNSFIGVFAEYGTISGMLFLLLVAVMGKNMITIFFAKQKERRLFNSFFLGLPIILLTGIFDEPFFSPQIAVPTIMLVAYWNKYTEGSLQTDSVPSIEEYIDRRWIRKKKIGA